MIVPGRRYPTAAASPGGITVMSRVKVVPAGGWARFGKNMRWALAHAEKARKACR